MPKFSDSNYDLLEKYFEEILDNGVPTGYSSIIGPNKTVISDGGIYSILYELDDERGFVGHRFIIQEIDGNRFKMKYDGLESTHSVATSAFDIGNEMYFRKDSFFHWWLQRPEQDDLYHNYANQERTFLYFGKIWPTSQTTEKIYSIEFTGLKDWARQAIPAHNQTTNMVEWLKVYFDRVQHEPYNMTKTFWSMFDAREIDDQWLGYISQIYGIEINEEGLINELPLREWVENLPYFVKRIGTYNDLYVVWQLLLSNSRNTLNVYERWGEWCIQNVSGIVDDFVDYHFLEFYGVQPSGGAGLQWYSQFDPADYPTHTTSATAPVTGCGKNAWDCGNPLNYLLFKIVNLNCSVGNIYEDEIHLTGFNSNSVETKFIALSGGNYSGDFTHCTSVEMSSSIVETISTSGSNIIFYMLSNEMGNFDNHSSDYLAIQYEILNGVRKLVILDSTNGTTYSTFAYQADVRYYLILDRTGTTFTIKVYDKATMFDEDLVETITHTLGSSESFTVLHALNFQITPSAADFYGTIGALSVDDEIQNTLTVGTSGYPVITPHYIVEVDLSSEPISDLYEDENFIMGEDLIRELIRNWEYVRPVSKYVHYQELIAPSASIDRSGIPVALYESESKGFMDTTFTGSKFISAGTSFGGEGTTTHFQQFLSKTWTVNHGLGETTLLVQPWVFKNALDETGAFRVRPKDIQIIDPDTVKITFEESVWGVATIAGSGSDGVGYVHTESTPSSAWSISHNLSTNTPSGYSSAAPGPVVNHWEGAYKVLPNRNRKTDGDTMDSFFGPINPISGSSLVRRADYVHTQDDPSDVWTVNHKLNGWIIGQVYALPTAPGETSNSEIVPDKWEIIDEDTCKLYWESNQRGYVHLIYIPKDRVLYSPYSCDITGIGVCPEILGYWKVGNGQSTTWNPVLQNDLESPTASGAFKDIYETAGKWFIDFEVPEKGDLDIYEIGIFNFQDDMIFFTRCTELFKPDGTKLVFHYRINKLED